MRLENSIFQSTLPLVLELRRLELQHIVFGRRSAIKSDPNLFEYIVGMMRDDVKHQNQVQFFANRHGANTSMSRIVVNLKNYNT